LSRGLGTGAAPLAAADLAILNLETAITDGGDPAPGKQFVFRAPPQAFDVLRTAGVDAVSMANNHGMDYGASGLRDSLAAAAERSLPVLGAGLDRSKAWAPLRRVVRGVRISVIAATDVLDDELRTAWTAADEAPGLASAKEGTAFADAVAAERPAADILVAFVHWGVEKQVCPTGRQRELAQQLVDAGADVVVGSHAHVLQPRTSVPTPAGASLVAYGLGNFVFYGRTDQATRSGVLTVTAKAVPGAGPAGKRSVSGAWTGARIVGGRPRAVTGAELAAVQLPPRSGC
jgi:poly-gamma-glutamate synthesis protein (capsule biosynthesis protein)